ncbi:MAG: ThuA domain-containing protein [Chitinophagaceae bacterium]|nr:MAG: ThuA domain-containing protein [Chitinophagaceae bacterium]
MLFSVRLLLLILLCCGTKITFAQNSPDLPRVMAFFSAKHDHAHISFVAEANRWFDSLDRAGIISYDSVKDWSYLTETSTRNVNLLVFLDSRPPAGPARSAFEKYMREGGGWIGFHFSAFALTPSDYPHDWPWYHDEFLGSGEYGSNTWRPTAAVLRIENKMHPITRGLPATFVSAPNEWYRWSKDLRLNPEIDILVAIDSSSFPLGTGPKPHEIWHEGYYPVAWSNRKYKMAYFNMGHNDIDYETGSLRTLSQTFGNPFQDKLILNAILTLTKINAAIR